MTIISFSCNVGVAGVSNFVCLNNREVKHSYRYSAAILQDCDLTHQSIFSCLSQQEMELMEHHKSCLFFKKGQHVFHEGNFPHGIYCIDIGKVKLEHSGDEGKMQIVRFAKAGDIIGYRALFSNEPYNATATALDDTNICFIPADVLRQILSSNNRLAQNLINLLAEDLRHAENNLTQLAQKTVRQRLAHALLVLKDTYGVKDDHGTINVLLTRVDISNLVGTATETAIRLLADLKYEGCLEFEGKQIRILDTARLKSVAEGLR